MPRCWFYLPIQMAAPFRLWVCGHSLAGIAGLNPIGGMDICLLWILCVFSGRGVCVRLITRARVSYRVWCVWVWSWSLVETLALWGLSSLKKTKLVSFTLIDSTTDLCKIWNSITVFPAAFRGTSLQDCTSSLPLDGCALCYRIYVEYLMFIRWANKFVLIKQKAHYILEEAH
jgi:hypothetical protein